MEAEEGFMTCLFMVDLESGEARECTEMARSGLSAILLITATQAWQRQTNTSRNKKMADTAKYKFISPRWAAPRTLGAAPENDNFDKLDDLLGDEQPVNGIIESGTIDGSPVTGEIGGSDPDNPTSIHPDTEISGKVKRLTGMDDPDGKIEDVSVDTRDITIDGKSWRVTSPVTSTSPTFSPDNGSIAVGIINQSTTYNYNLAMPEKGQSLTLILNKSTSDNTNIVWKHNNNSNAVLWVGGGEPRSTWA